MAIKYKWLAGRLREQLPDYTANGIHRLPTEAAISQRYKVSRQTVRQALSVLEQEGLIEKRQGSGSYITGRSRGEDRIDLLLSSDSAYLYPMLLHDIKKTLAAQGFSTTVHITENTFSTEHTLLQKILHQPPRALLVEGVKTARTNPNLDLYRKLQKKKCPVLFLQESYPELTNCHASPWMTLAVAFCSPGICSPPAIPASVRSFLRICVPDFCAARGCCMPCGTQMHFRKIP